jgi:predicted PurR-regulated permease PerM
MVVAVTNLIPTFGPIIGGAIGAFLLLLVEPWYALVFIIFTLILQNIDGYILKPKLVGDSVGVSGLWVLIGVIVGGKMFGIVGILLAIPGVAILDMLYGEFLLPWLEKDK